jgi:hypothetical protein
MRRPNLYLNCRTAAIFPTSSVRNCANFRGSDLEKHGFAVRDNGGESWVEVSPPLAG